MRAFGNDQRIQANRARAASARRHPLRCDAGVARRFLSANNSS
jgi:hypothetical protein